MMDTTLPVRRKNGNLLVPFSVEAADGDLGDGVKELTPDDPEYAQWEAWLKRRGLKARDEEEEKNGLKG